MGVCAQAALVGAGGVLVMRTHPDKMSFLEHLDELRVRLIHSVVALCVSTGVAWIWREQIFDFLTQPLRKAMPDIEFIFTAPTESIILYMKMAFFVGIFLAAPYILYQAWAFIAPGLYAHEKHYVVPFVLMGSVCFTGGAAFGHFILFPATFDFLGNFGGRHMKYFPKVDEYFTFYSWFLLGLGAVFQTPVIIVILSRIGLVTPRFLLRQWKWAVVLSFVIAAFVTPSPDMVNQTALAIPMIGLYFLGVLAAWAFGRPRRKPEDVSGAVQK
jgi:sec-independent protein translocase protein TatC